MLRRSKKATDRKTALAMVLLESPRPLTPETLQSTWTSTWPAHAAPKDFTSTGDTMTMSLGRDWAGVTSIPVPVPNHELDRPAATSWLWPNATDAIAKVGSHVIAFTSHRDVVDAHLALTRLVVAVAKATDAMGVYWGAAGHVVRADVFESFAREFAGQALPLLLWIDFRGFADGSTAHLATVGMTAFALMEIEIFRSAKPIAELRDFAVNIASYLIANGPVIADGNTVGGTAEERVVVRHTSSILDRAGLVYRLEGL
jgi:Domain of unknown function (DUF4261)